MRRNNSKTHTKWWQILVITILVMGVFFRLVNLDRKIFSNEETATLVRSTGHTWAEMEQLNDGR